MLKSPTERRGHAHQATDVATKHRTGHVLYHERSLINVFWTVWKRNGVDRRRPSSGLTVLLIYIPGRGFGLCSERMHHHPRREVAHAHDNSSMKTFEAKKHQMFSQMIAVVS